MSTTSNRLRELADQIDREELIIPVRADMHIGEALAQIRAVSHHTSIKMRVDQWNNDKPRLVVAFEAWDGTRFYEAKTLGDLVNKVRESHAERTQEQELASLNAAVDEEHDQDLLALEDQKIAAAAVISDPFSCGPGLLAQ